MEKTNESTCSAEDLSEHMLYRRPFVIDGVHCVSFISFLYAITFSDPMKRIEACALSAEEALDQQSSRFSPACPGFFFWDGKVYKKSDLKKLTDCAFSILCGSLPFKQQDEDFFACLVEVDTKADG